MSARKPSLGGADFGEYGRTSPRIPICIFALGAVRPERLNTPPGQAPLLPSLHSAQFAPAVEPAIKSGVTAMTAAALELLKAPPSPASSR